MALGVLVSERAVSSLDLTYKRTCSEAPPLRVEGLLPMVPLLGSSGIFPFNLTYKRACSEAPLLRVEGLLPMVPLLRFLRLPSLGPPEVRYLQRTSLHGAEMGSPRFAGGFQ
jgi:hypothetical protein